MPTESILDEFAQKTTIHGLKDLFTARRRSNRFVRLLLTIGVFGGLIFQIARLFVVTSPSVAHITPTKQLYYEYPHVRFCPRYWINESAVENLNLSENAFLFAVSLLVQVNLKKNLTTGLAVAKKELEEYMLRNNLSDYLQLYPRFGYQSTQIFDCTGCAQNGMGNAVVTSQGLCYDFYFKPMLSNSYDNYPKASFTFYPPPEPQLTFYQNDYNADSLYVGENVEDFFGYDPIFINFNTSILIGIRTQIRKRLSIEDQICFSREEFLSRGYPSVKMCFADCRAWIGGTFCRKSVGLGHFKPQKNRRPDLYSSYNSSQYRTQKYLDQCYKERKSLLDPCYKNCRPNCDETVYDLKVEVVDPRATSIVPKEDATNTDLLYAIRVSDSIFDFDHSRGKPVTKVAFVHSLKNGLITIEEMTTWTADTLISNLGGLTSLWLGASVLSILHAIGCCIRGIAKRLMNRTEVEVVHF